MHSSGGVGSPPRDEEGGGSMCIEGMWRLFLGCVEGGPLLLFSPSLPLSPEEMKESGGKED